MRLRQSSSSASFGCILKEKSRWPGSQVRYDLLMGIRRLSRKTLVLRQKCPKPTSQFTAKQPAAYESLAAKMILRNSPTLLYQAASHTPYKVGCYMVGGLFISMAGYNFQSQYYFPTAELPKYVPVSISVGSFMLACYGFFIVFRTHNIVKSISSVPSLNKLGPPTLLLQIERTSALPFKRPKTVRVSPNNVTLSSRLFNDDRDNKVDSIIAEISFREERLRTFAKTNLLTLPFRQASYWMWRGFVGIRRTFTSEGFNYLHIKGNNRVWKLDRDPAWALDDGKVLDRLVKIKLA